MKTLFKIQRITRMIILPVVLCSTLASLHAFDEVLRIEKPEGVHKFSRALLGDFDVTGDGRNDVFVSSHFINQDADAIGKVQAFSGSDGSLLWEVLGETGQFGRAIDRAGDYNKDGVQDLLVNEPSYDQRGRVLVISGLTGELLAQFVDPDGQTRRSFGRNLAYLGDINNDQRPDYLATIPNHINEDGSRGAVAVISGADGSLLYHCESDENSLALGVSLLALGDIDGDHIPDFAAGNKGLNGAGRVHVYSGKTGDLLYIVKGKEESPNGFFGYSLANIGDVDGDQINDFVAGATHESNMKGRVALHSGANGTLILEVTGAAVNTYLGKDVSGVGDVNGDGINDFAASAKDLTQDYVTVYSGVDGSVLKETDKETTNVGPNVVYAGADQWQGEAAMLIGINSKASVYRGIEKDTEFIIIRHSDGGLTISGHIKSIDDDEDEQP